MMIPIKIRINLLLMLSFFFLQAQDTVTTSGNDIIGGSGSISYTIGQTMYLTDSTSNISFAQGVQQAFEISILLVIDYSDKIKLEIAVYPNPTSNYLNLKTNFKKTLSYQLYDLQGRLLIFEKINTSSYQIDLKNLAISTYFLKVSSGSNIIKTFKIVKH